ncbi:MAG: hypothetical protein TU35_004840 [Thermoproteus sp. AZ2]|uniref:Uncharacterized protein n=1 Tax=Thermoproteus sp. AZ2 TaxID=1609232 RepID=A0ACC6V0I5_9CREN
MRIVAKYSREGLYVNGKPVPPGLKPIELLVAALAYGVGARHIDLGAEEYEVVCDVEGDSVVCRAPCAGIEEMCLVYRIVAKGDYY